MSVYDDPNRQALGLDPVWAEPNSSSGEAAEAGETEPKSLDAMTKAELLAYAQELGVTPANNDMTKEQLRAGVDAKLAEGG